MAFSITNPLYPKPSWAANAAVAGQLLTVTSTAVVTCATAPNNLSDCVMFDVKSNSVNVTVDGTDPATGATGTGHTLASGTAYTWSKSMVAQARFIATTTNNAVIYFSELQV